MVETFTDIEQLAGGATVIRIQSPPSPASLCGGAARAAAGCASGRRGRRSRGTWNSAVSYTRTLCAAAASPCACTCCHSPRTRTASTPCRRWAPACRNPIYKACTTVQLKLNANQNKYVQNITEQATTVEYKPGHLKKYKMCCREKHRIMHHVSH